MTDLTARVDHLVVHAATLDEGAAWCERTLGVAPQPGGRHPTMGTHNLLLALGSGAYLEIIAVDAAAKPPPHARWFAMDDPARRSHLQHGPALVHFVVNTPDIAAALRQCPYDLGAAREATRGALRWKISLRNDGALHEDGLIPTLIEWCGAHPSAGMPPSGLGLRALNFEHPQAERIEAAHAAVGLRGGAIALRYVPAGRMRLSANLVRSDGQSIELSSL